MQIGAAFRCAARITLLPGQTMVLAWARKLQTNVLSI